MLCLPCLLEVVDSHPVLRPLVVVKSLTLLQAILLLGIHSLERGIKRRDFQKTLIRSYVWKREVWRAEISLPLEPWWNDGPILPELMFVGDAFPSLEADFVPGDAMNFPAKAFNIRLRLKWSEAISLLVPSGWYVQQLYRNDVDYRRRNHYRR